jgi:tRNA dimethylallyltransferase
MKFDNHKILVLTGATGSGKTDLALEWVEKYPQLEIVSVDSALIYRGMDIGTAKPDPSILSSIPHHLVNIKDPAESYSVAEFCRDCKSAVENIFSRGKTPFLVGGTMMYLNALREGLADIPAAHEMVRKELFDTLGEHGIERLYERLKAKDPLSADRLKPTDTQRILRALEVVESTGKPIHTYWSQNQKVINNPFIFTAIAVEDRSILHQRIQDRTEKMMKNGLIDEVRRLYERGDLHAELPSIRSVGYRQVWDYFLGKSVLKEVDEKITISTRQLAKRQITWMRSWPDIYWIRPGFNLVDIGGQFLK